MRKKWMAAAVLAAGLMLSACQAPGDAGVAETESAVETESAAEQENPAETAGSSETESSSQAETDEAAPSEAALEDLWGMLGMADAETADLFGGGEENWSADKEFYIGRMYQVNLFEETYPVYTSCDDAGTVNSVSVWISNGEKEVTGEYAEQWADRLTEAAGVEPVYNETESEAGSKNWKWVFDGKIISMHWLENLLSVDMNPAVGELK